MHVLAQLNKMKDGLEEQLSQCRTRFVPTFVPFAKEAAAAATAATSPTTTTSANPSASTSPVNSRDGAAPTTPTGGSSPSLAFRFAESVEVKVLLRVAAEGETYLYCRFSLEDKSVSKWMTQAAVADAFGDVALPEELSSTIKRVTEDSRREVAALQEANTHLQNDYDSYKKKTKTATALLQDKLNAAAAQVDELTKAVRLPSSW